MKLYNHNEIYIRGCNINNDKYRVDMLHNKMLIIIVNCSMSSFLSSEKCLGFLLKGKMVT